MKFIAGIDGGGTKTRVCCCSLDGAEIETRTFGAFNINSIGLGKFRTLLSDITAFLKSVGECSAVCIGSAGISNEVMADAVSDAMKDAGIRNWKLVGDNVIALAGALDGGAGIILIAGTGSICFGRGRNGEEARSGGWGHLIGDEGSAYALGRDALSAVARAMDGYGKQTMLTSLLASELGLDTRSRIISYTYSGDKSTIAALSHLVETAAAKGDDVALKIIADNAEKMAELVEAVAGKLGLESTEVAMMGGRLEHDTFLRAGFIRVMDSRFPAIECIAPKKDACAGAVMMAKEMLKETE